MPADDFDSLVERVHANFDTIIGACRRVDLGTEADDIGRFQLLHLHPAGHPRKLDEDSRTLTQVSDTLRQVLLPLETDRQVISDLWDGLGAMAALAMLTDLVRSYTTVAETSAAASGVLSKCSEALVAYWTGLAQASASTAQAVEAAPDRAAAEPAVRDFVDRLDTLRKYDKHDFGEADNELTRVINRLIDEPKVAAARHKDPRTPLTLAAIDGKPRESVWIRKSP